MWIQHPIWSILSNGVPLSLWRGKELGIWMESVSLVLLGYLGLWLCWPLNPFTTQLIKWEVSFKKGGTYLDGLTLLSFPGLVTCTKWLDTTCKYIFVVIFKVNKRFLNGTTMEHTTWLRNDFVTEKFLCLSLSVCVWVCVCVCVWVCVCVYAMRWDLKFSWEHIYLISGRIYLTRKVSNICMLSCIFQGVG